MRLLLGDTDPANPKLSDGEIQYFITQGNSVSVRAAYLAALALVAKYSQLLSISVGPARLEFRTITAQLQELVHTLAQQGGRPSSLDVGPPVDQSSLVPPVIGGADWDNNRVY